MHVIVEFDKPYVGLMCEDVPRRQLKSVEDRGGCKRDSEHSIDPWDGEKPYAKDGFCGEILHGESSMTRSGTWRCTLAWMA